MQTHVVSNCVVCECSSLVNSDQQIHITRKCVTNMINVTLQILLKGWLIMQEFCDHSDRAELYDIYLYDISSICDRRL